MEEFNKYSDNFKYLRAWKVGTSPHAQNIRSKTSLTSMETTRQCFSQKVFEFEQILLLLYDLEQVLCRVLYAWLLFVSEKKNTPNNINLPRVNYLNTYLDDKLKISLSIISRFHSHMSIIIDLKLKIKVTKLLRLYSIIQ